MLTYDDWNEITNRIQSLIAQSGQSFIQSDVLKVDPLRKLIWVEETGTTPIPLFAFDYTFTDADGNTITATPACPQVGDTVLIALHLGSRRLPKCLGKAQSIDIVEP